MLVVIKGYLKNSKNLIIDYEQKSKNLSSLVTSLAYPLCSKFTNIKKLIEGIKKLKLLKALKKL